MEQGFGQLDPCKQRQGAQLFNGDDLVPIRPFRQIFLDDLHRISLFTIRGPEMWHQIDCVQDVRIQFQQALEFFEDRRPAFLFQAVDDIGQTQDMVFAQQTHSFFRNCEGIVLTDPGNHRILQRLDTHHHIVDSGSFIQRNQVGITDHVRRRHVDVEGQIQISLDDHFKQLSGQSPICGKILVCKPDHFHPIFFF